MRIIQCLVILSILLPFTSISADETLTVSVYYPYGYIWVGPYQVIPVLTRYVIPVCLKGAGPKRPMTPKPLLTTATPMGPVTPTPATMGPVPPTPASMGPVTDETPTTTTTRRGDN